MDNNYPDNLFFVIVYTAVFTNDTLAALALVLLGFYIDGYKQFQTK